MTNDQIKSAIKTAELEFQKALGRLIADGWEIKENKVNENSLSVSNITFIIGTLEQIYDERVRGRIED